MKPVPWAALGALFALLIPVWFSFDHRLPSQDEAGHILNSIQYIPLVKHPKFWMPSWWHDFLTVNQFYPPTVYIFNGILKRFLGTARWVDFLSLTCFNVVLSASIFGTTAILLKSARAALMAMTLINVYPLACTMSHSYFLDYPLLAMTSLGICALVWWNEAPSWRRAVLTGVALGAAGLTKQLAAVFLFPVGFYYAVKTVWVAASTRKPQELAQLLVIGSIGGVICGPWVLLNAKEVNHVADGCAVVMQPVAPLQALVSNLSFYAVSAPRNLSPLLLTVFLVSVLAIGGAGNRRLLPLLLSFIGGLLAVSTLTWIFPTDRYFVPALVAPAIYSAAGLDAALRSANRVVRAIPLVVLAVTMAQFISFNFTPYPLAKPEWLSHFCKPPSGASGCPTPPQDWGQEWAIRIIDRVDKDLPVYLNVVANSEQLNAHTFELIVHDMHSLVKPTTSKHYTIMGDKEKFSKEAAMYYHWYLIKEGRQGFRNLDELSAVENSKLVQFVEHSGHFTLIDTHPLPDRTTLLLYRQNFVRPPPFPKP